MPEPVPDLGVPVDHPVAVVQTPMRDGVVLVGDVHGALDQPRPVLLERTPYGRRELRSSDQDRYGAAVPTPWETTAFFVAAGYLIVRQDCRGRGDSGGEFVKYLNEGPDGADTIAWIREQPWCNGQVATMGVSYSAHTQTAAAAEGPEGLAAMFLDSGGLSSAYEAGMRMGGAFELKQVTWAYTHALYSPEAAADPVVHAGLAGSKIEEWLTALPWKPGLSPLRHVPAYECYLLEQWSRETFDDYWTVPSIYARGSYDSFPDVPNLHLGSWYDPYVRSTIENHLALRESGTSPSYLVMGPWTHGRRVQTFAGDVDFGIEAAFDVGLRRSYLEFRRAWFDSHLDPDSDRSDFAPVTYFLMGGGSGRSDQEGRLSHGGRWRTSEAWPPPEAAPLLLHLTSEGALTPAAHAGAASVSFDYDPSHPVPTIGGQVTSGEPVMSGGAFDQTPDERVYGATPPYLPLSARPDVVCLRTAVLEEELTVVGPVRARLWVSSSAVDTDITIKLIDEYPPSEDFPQGFAMNLTDGIFRCRFHESYGAPVALEPGKPFLIEVVAPDTANVFAPGHRLRLDVSSSNFPRFDVNRNTGLGSSSPLTAIARNSIHTSVALPSALELYVVPGSPALETSSAHQRH